MLNRLCPLALVAGLLTGCGNSSAEKPKQKTKKSVFQRTTQDIGKFDPNAGYTVSDSKINATNPITGPLEAYGPMVEKASKLGIDYNLSLYNAEHGRYPNYEEFMTDIVKKYNIRLKVLPGGNKYMYDEANHRLVVVEPLPDNKAEKEE